MILEVAFLPQVVFNQENKVSIVIDVLRATTTIVTMFEQGAEKICLAETVNTAKELAASTENSVLCGEVGGLPPEGFHFGNSPLEYLGKDLTAKNMIFRTSNGTKALAAVSDSAAVLVGSFLNASAVVDAALSLGKNICVVCSGRALGMSFGLDDAYCAGYLVHLILQRMKTSSEAPLDIDFSAMISNAAPEVEGFFVDESAIAAHKIYIAYQGDTAAAFADSGNGRGLIQLGLAGDLEYCGRVDTSWLVPALAVEGGKFILVRNYQPPL